MKKEYQVQCAECLCTLYFTDGVSGITGELCSGCQEEEDYWDDDDD